MSLSSLSFLRSRKATWVLSSRTWQPSTASGSRMARSRGPGQAQLASAGTRWQATPVHQAASALCRPPLWHHPTAPGQAGRTWDSRLDLRAAMPLVWADSSSRAARASPSSWRVRSACSAAMGSAGCTPGLPHWQHASHRLHADPGHRQQGPAQICLQSAQAPHRPAALSSRPAPPRMAAQPCRLQTSTDRQAVSLTPVTDYCGGGRQSDMQPQRTTRHWSTRSSCHGRAPCQTCPPQPAWPGRCCHALPGDPISG